MYRPVGVSSCFHQLFSYRIATICCEHSKTNQHHTQRNLSSQGSIQHAPWCCLFCIRLELRYFVFQNPFGTQVLHIPLFGGFRFREIDETIAFSFSCFNIALTSARVSWLLGNTGWSSQSEEIVNVSRHSPIGTWTVQNISYFKSLKEFDGGC